MFGHDTIEMEDFMRMQAYRIEKIIPQNGNLQLTALPFQAGELVDIIILRREDQVRSTTSDLLKGTVLKYEEPTEPVAREDWKTHEPTRSYFNRFVAQTD